MIGNGPLEDSFLPCMVIGLRVAVQIRTTPSVLVPT